MATQLCVTLIRCSMNELLGTQMFPADAADAADMADAAAAAAAACGR